MNGTSILLLLGGLDLSICVADVPFSVLNIVLIGRTPLVHFNLKCILLFQSGSILLRALLRIAICCLKFVLNDPIGAEFIGPWFDVYHFSLYNRNFSALVLIVERIVATKRVKTYERKKNVKLSLCWMLLALTTSAVFASLGGTGAFVIALSDVVLVSAQACLALVQFAIFRWLFAHSRRVLLQKLENSANRHSSLSERYQVTENTRIGCQLMPTMLFQLFNEGLTALVNYSGYLRMPTYAYFASAAITSISLSGVLIEVSMIWCHPFLRRDFASLARRVARCLVGDRRTHPQATLSTLEVPRDGRREQDRHFAMLNEFWELKK